MWTVYELACFLSPLVVDVVLPEVTQRQVLAVPCRFTVEGHRFSSSTSVGFQFLDQVVGVRGPALH